MESKNKIILVRIPRKLINSCQIGYGWKINFSKYENTKDLLHIGFKDCNIGRKTKQIKRYFNLKKDDLVVIPVSGAIAIAIVEGAKTYKLDPTIKHGENRIQVKYLSDKNENIFIPRKVLSTRLQNRLKIRMSIADLEDFRDEIETHIKALDRGEIHTWAKEIEAKESQAAENFKTELLVRLGKGKRIGLAAGGYGLEVLVKELLEIKGYDAKIQAKNASSGIDDVDIIASKYNDLTADKEGLFIQVKHHHGLTSNKGLKQLDAYKVDKDDYAFYRKVLITSAELDEAVKKDAEKKNIVIMEGEQLVRWIYDNIDQLNPKTKVTLGITTAPSLL